MPKYFTDSEFVEDGVTIELISIALVADDGREYYAQNLEARLDRASEWVKIHVLPKLERTDILALGHPVWNRESVHLHTPWRSRVEIRDEITAFCDPAKYGRPEFYANFCSYDWVALCQLFGPMVSLPKDWPRYCNDLKQYSEDLKRRFGLEKAPRCSVSQGPDEHNARSDARWDKTYYVELVALDAQLTSGSHV